MALSLYSIPVSSVGKNSPNHSRDRNPEGCITVWIEMMHCGVVQSRNHCESGGGHELVTFGLPRRTLYPLHHGVVTNDNFGGGGGRLHQYCRILRSILRMSNTVTSDDTVLFWINIHAVFRIVGCSFCCSWFLCYFAFTTLQLSPPVLLSWLSHEQSLLSRLEWNIVWAPSKQTTSCR